MMAGSVDVAELLITAGANLLAIDSWGHDMLDLQLGLQDSSLPSEHGVAIARKWAGFFDMERLYLDELTRLGVACLHVNLPAVEIFVEHGANVRALHSHGRTMLHAACWYDDVHLEHEHASIERIIALLIRAGCPIDAVDESGDAALHTAAHGDGPNSTAITTLLRLGADIEQRNHAGQTALMVAAQHGRLPSVKTLLDAGANPLLIDASGRDVLGIANGNLQSVQETTLDHKDVGEARDVINGVANAIMDIISGGEESYKPDESIFSPQQLNKYYRQLIADAKQIIKLVEAAIRAAENKDGA